MKQQLFKMSVAVMCSFFMLAGCDNSSDELQNEITQLQEVIAEQEGLIEELQAEMMVSTEVVSEMEALQNDFMENAGAELSELMGVEVIFDDPESIDFGLIDRGYVWAQGRWESDVDIPRNSPHPETVDTLFRYFVSQDGGISWFLQTYGFGRGWGAGNPNHRSWGAGIQRRYLEMDVVLVRFYNFYTIDGWDENYGYVEEQISGQYFVEEMIESINRNLGRHVVDMWFVGSRLYVNLHPEENFSTGGTFGERIWYEEMLLTFTSIPDIDEVVMLVGGVREAWVGTHGRRFADIYRVDDPQLIEWREE